MRTPFRIKALFRHKNWFTVALNDIKTVDGFVITYVPRAAYHVHTILRKEWVGEEFYLKEILEMLRCPCP